MAMGANGTREARVLYIHTRDGATPVQVPDECGQGAWRKLDDGAVRVYRF